MAVFISILSPDPVALSEYQHIVEQTADRILPPCAQQEKQFFASPASSLLVAILGRREQVTVNGHNILAGVRMDGNGLDDWWQVDGPVPDGSFALFRGNTSVLEAVTDVAGSKTIWHARLRCGGVVASTSMELIVTLLGDFECDDETMGWFLSSGSSGPRRSWDRRIRPLAPNCRLQATSDGTSVSANEARVRQPGDPVEKVDFDTLEKELTRAVSGLDYGKQPWLLALSGGHDSRAILHGTQHLENLTCVTWVDEHLTDRPSSDIAIARRLAERTGREHLVKVIERPDDAPALEAALRRFVRYSDGRVDNYLAYVDGMRIWDELGAMEYGGLLRGDELFGTAIAARSPQILRNMRLNTFFDFAASPEQEELVRLHGHSVPEDLMQAPQEDSGRWRWRLRADHEIPTVYAGLNSIRARFAEVSCPLLSGHLVRLAQSMRTRDLDDKNLFNKVVGGQFPDIPFAERTSILRRSDVLAIPEATELLLDHMNSSLAHETLGRRCSDKIAKELRRLGSDSSRKFDDSGVAFTKKSTTAAWMKRIKRRFDPPPQLHPPTLGMRSFLIRLVKEEFTESARIGAAAREQFQAGSS